MVKMLASLAGCVQVLRKWADHNSSLLYVAKITDSRKTSSQENVRRN